jgi:ribonuclease J
MNCLVLEWGDEIVLIDCGIQFPDARYAGADLLAPDFTYLHDKWDRIRGVVVTHGHDDHIGAIPILARYTDLDIYCTAFPRGLIELRQSEIDTDYETRFHRIRPGKQFSIGSFTFEPISVHHSIIESLGLAIHTPVGTIVHTGDFKHDPHEADGSAPFEDFKRVGESGVRLLFSDSTNAERSGHTVSEASIEESFERIFSNQTGRIFIALFASNIRRIERLLGLAKKLGKKVALAGRSMHAYTRIAFEQKSLSIPQDILIPISAIHTVESNHLIILTTGSQAEARSALLRMSQGTHNDVQIRAGDLVLLSSRFIPGNERAITGMIDNLCRSGADVLYESIHQIHVSGHGFQDELEMMLKAVRPEYFVPVHGEYRHLAKHALIARRTGIDHSKIHVIENGQTLELTSHGLEIGERLQLQKIVLVENELMHRNPEIFSQRASLAKTGILFATFLVDSRSRRLLLEPHVSAHGVLYRESEPDASVIAEEASYMLARLYKKSGREEDFLEMARIELRRFFKHRASHKPVVVPLLLEL